MTMMSSSKSRGDTGRRGSGGNKWSLGVFVPNAMKKKKNDKKKATAEDAAGASSRGSLLKRISDRRLVKQMSLSLLEVEGETAAEKRKALTQNESCSATFKQGDLSASSLGLLDQDDDLEEQLQVVPLFDGSSMSQTGGAGSGTGVGSQLPPLPAPLHRKELALGEKLGTGGFSEVFALDGIQLKTREMKAKLKAKSRTFSPQEFDAREILQQRIHQTRKNPTQKFAVKHLSPDLLTGNPSMFQAAATDLEREAQLLSCINHPNIIRVRGIAMGGMASCFTATGNIDEYFVVMDALKETLDARIYRWNRTSLRHSATAATTTTGGTTSSSTPPALTTKIHYGMQLASALEFLHARRLIYRDIKPPNIGFLPDPTAPDGERLQLFDFGLCRLLPMEAHKKLRNDDGEVVYRMSQAGSRRYLAPELYNRDQLRSKCYYNCKADVYSWALTFYEILSQRKPFHKFDCPEKLALHISKDHGRPSLQDIEERYHKNLIKSSSGIRTNEAEELVLHSLKRILHLSWTHYSSERPNMAGILNQLYPLLVLLEQGRPTSMSQEREDKKNMKVARTQPGHRLSSSKSKGSTTTEKANLAPRTTHHAAVGGNDMISPQIVSGPRAA